MKNKKCPFCGGLPAVKNYGSCSYLECSGSGCPIYFEVQICDILTDMFAQAIGRVYCPRAAESKAQAEGLPMEQVKLERTMAIWKAFNQALVVFGRKNQD